MSSTDELQESAEAATPQPVQVPKLAWPLIIAIWQIVPARRALNTVLSNQSEHTSIATLAMVRQMSEQ